MSEGYICISRKLFENPLWTKKRQFSYAEAWIDLIQTASYTNDNKMIFEGQMVKWDRGELAASVRFLKERWQWNSTATIKRFLYMLIGEQMIDINTEQRLSVIRICKYDTYNLQKNPIGTATKRQQNSNETATKRNISKSNKGTKESKENTVSKGEPSTLYSKMVKVYSDWYESQVGTKPKMDNVMGKGMKDIITYLTEISKDTLKKKSKELTAENVEQNCIDIFTYVFDNWKKIDPFLQDKTKTIEIGANMQNILKQIRAKAVKQAEQITIVQNQKLPSIPIRAKDLE